MFLFDFNSIRECDVAAEAIKALLDATKEVAGTSFARKCNRVFVCDVLRYLSAASGAAGKKSFDFAISITLPDSLIGWFNRNRERNGIGLHRCLCVAISLCDHFVSFDLLVGGRRCCHRCIVAQSRQRVR
jgi:hypothetical protein